MGFLMKHVLGMVVALGLGLSALGGCAVTGEPGAFSSNPLKGRASLSYIRIAPSQTLYVGFEVNHERLGLNQDEVDRSFNFPSSTSIGNVIDGKIDGFSLVDVQAPKGWTVKLVQTNTHAKVDRIDSQYIYYTFWIEPVLSVQAPTDAKPFPSLTDLQDDPAKTDEENAKTYEEVLDAQRIRASIFRNGGQKYPVRIALDVVDPPKPTK
jgi:hypothetical protein